MYIHPYAVSVPCLCNITCIPPVRGLYAEFLWLGERANLSSFWGCTNGFSLDSPASEKNWQRLFSSCCVKYDLSPVTASVVWSVIWAQWRPVLFCFNRCVLHATDNFDPEYYDAAVIGSCYSHGFCLIFIQTMEKCAIPPEEGLPLKRSVEIITWCGSWICNVC